MPSGTTVRAAAVLAIALVAAAPAEAAMAHPLDETLSVELGTFFYTTKTTVRADGDTTPRPGTPVELEDTFGFRRENLLRGDVTWRFARRHKLQLMYFGSDRTAQRVIRGQIDYGDASYPAGALVQARFETRVLELAYQYDFVQRERYEIGALVGVHGVSLGTRLDGIAGIVGTTTSGRVEAKASTRAPLPVVGLRGTWHLADRWFVQGRAQVFHLDFGDYSGNFRDYQLSVVWQATRRIGLGAGYNVFRLRTDISDPGNFVGSVKWGYEGAQLFLRASF